MKIITSFSQYIKEAKDIDHIENIEIEDGHDEELEKEIAEYTKNNAQSCPRCGEKYDNCQCGDRDPWSTVNHHRVPKGEVKTEKPKQNFKI